ncbi:serine/threonine-protein kinase RsbW [Desulfatibacillum alkenivorans DSM 16219]|jgi:anti-sigma regulatory factor (Ser/Thr protein kinase)|uniref:Serine/threonine-protein kinase RsbW n=1 Tax=Desulfatibacillum alkenivorans DSM 16219 TaxID=1121393 RepID=A0A1M6HD98_9BACT|nr:ATP-binding protein [Desulfatibacillum alkenivorans]SHJ20238.1 serine/threonine-protein kinase RsbW [Desulfatibacillum alkenivorans DSM 16219]
MTVGEIKVSLKNKLAELEKLHEKIEEFLASKGGSRKALFQLKLALEEVFVNIVHYGFEDDKEHDINMTLSFTPPHITIKVEDDGKAFDPINAEEPDLSKPLSCRAPGGLGVFLTKWCCDLNYRRENGKNILTIKKTLVDNDKESNTGANTA